MSTSPKENKPSREKLTSVLRGRCEDKLKKEFSDFAAATPHREGHWVRTAVREFMERHFKKGRAA
jgi:hypothetical protein